MLSRSMAAGFMIGSSVVLDEAQDSFLDLRPWTLESFDVTMVMYVGMKCTASNRSL